MENVSSTDILTQNNTVVTTDTAMGTGTYVKKGVSGVRLGAAGGYTGLEKIAYLVAAVMMLSPLAAAAWGAHFGA